MGKSKSEQMADQRANAVNLPRNYTEAGKYYTDFVSGESNKPLLTSSDYAEIDKQIKEQERADLAIVKAWLSRGFKINERIRITEQNIEFWKTLANKVTSNPSEVMVDNSQAEQGGRVQTFGTKIVDAMHENQADLEYLCDIKRETDWTISLVDDTVCRMLLQLRYGLFKTWEQIAAEMNYDFYYVEKELHTKALRKIKYYVQSKISAGSDPNIKPRPKYDEFGAEQKPHKNTSGA
jgi:hypothetical protein